MLISVHNIIFVKMRTSSIFWFALFICQVGFAQKTVEGVTFAEKHTYSGNSLTLNGAGLREKWFLDLYVAGLYLPSKTNDASKIVNTDEPMTMRLKIVSSMVTSEKMAETTKEGFMKSMNGNLAPLQKEIDQFLGVFKNFQLKSGDLCELSYVPKEGVHFIVNGKELTLVKGLEFKKALFGIWLGKVPADETLKKSLLN